MAYSLRQEFIPLDASVTNVDTFGSSALFIIKFEYLIVVSNFYKEIIPRKALFMFSL